MSSLCASVETAPQLGLQISLQDVCTELLLHICTFVGVRDVGRLACVSTLFSKTLDLQALLSPLSFARCSWRGDGTGTLREATNLFGSARNFAEIEAFRAGEVHFHARAEAGGARLVVGGAECDVSESATTANLMRAGVHRVEISIGGDNLAGSFFRVGIGKQGYWPFGWHNCNSAEQSRRAQEGKGAWLWSIQYPLVGSNIDDALVDDCELERAAIKLRSPLVLAGTNQLSMQLDVDAGTLSLFRNRTKLAVLPNDLDYSSIQNVDQSIMEGWDGSDGLATGAPFCWVAEAGMESGDSSQCVSVRLRPVPPILGQ